MELPSSVKWLHPIIVCLFQVGLTVFAIGFIPPCSIIRLAMIPLSLASIYAVSSDYLDSFPCRVLASIVVCTSYLTFLQYLDIVVLSQWSFDRQGPEVDILKQQLQLQLQRKQNTRKNKGTHLVDGAAASEHAEYASAGGPSFSASSFSVIKRRFQYGYFITSASRLIGTDYQVKNVPNYSTSDPDFIPNRAQFLLRKIWIFCICYIALDLATVSNQSEENASRFNTKKIPFFRRLGEVTDDEIVQRLTASMAHWAVVYCLLQCYMGAWAVLSVALKSDPKYWRPNFGPLSEGYTIRRFWGKFWHQHLRRPLSSNATFLTESVLKLPKSTLLHRYTHITLVFLLSGVVHMFGHVAAHRGASSPSFPSSSDELSFHNSGCIEFFLTQALGIMIEDGAQEMWRRVEIRLGLGSDAEVAHRARTAAARKWHECSWMKKALGWVWLVAFLAWSTPALMYPAARLDTGKGKDVLLPFSVIRALK